jgi:RimJ/RimL family protein N-acetyltransferase
VAITSLDNQSSIRLLEKIGFRYEGLIKLPGNEEEIKLFAHEDATVDPSNSGPSS